MDLDAATTLVRETLLITLLVASPMLIIGLAVGVGLSVLQAVTQIQEQTLTMIPKIAAMLIAAALLMPWIGQQLMAYSGRVFLGSAAP